MVLRQESQICQKSAWLLDFLDWQEKDTDKSTGKFKCIPSGTSSGTSVDRHHLTVSWIDHESRPRCGVHLAGSLIEDGAAANARVKLSIARIDNAVGSAHGGTLGG
ncbi:hypothetical protein D3C87_1832790 [compost metagenome]